jgi:hypothetical protein
LRKERRLGVLENRVLRRIFVPKRDEVTGKWRTPDSKELNDLYSSPNIVRVIKSRKMIWGGSMYRVWVRGEEYKVLWWGNLRKRDNLGHPGVIERILRWIFRK